MRYSDFGNQSEGTIVRNRRSGPRTGHEVIRTAPARKRPSRYRIYTNHGKILPSDGAFRINSRMYVGGKFPIYDRWKVHLGANR